MSANKGDVELATVGHLPTVAADLGDLRPRVGMAPCTLPQYFIQSPLCQYQARYLFTLNGSLLLTTFLVTCPHRPLCSPSKYRNRP